MLLKSSILRIIDLDGLIIGLEIKGQCIVYTKSGMMVSAY